MELPQFTNDGVLPPGDHELTLEELETSFLVHGPCDELRYPNWERSWRLKLVQNLIAAVKDLWKVGITEIYVAGSFVEDVKHPSDIDCYFECERHQIEGGELEAKLTAINRDWKGLSQQNCGRMKGLRAVHIVPEYGTPYRFDGGPELMLPTEYRQSRRRGMIPRGIIKIVSHS